MILNININLMTLITSTSRRLISGSIYFGIAGLFFIKALDSALSNESKLITNIHVDSLYNELLNNSNNLTTTQKSDQEIFFEYKNKVKPNDYVKKNYPYLYKRMIEAN